jgi:O-methyltransferase
MNTTHPARQSAVRRLAGSVEALIKAAFVNGIGRLPDASDAFEKVACWIRFSRWCVQQRAHAGSYNAFPQYSYLDRYMLYERVIQEERLDEEGINFLEFGVYRGESIAWWRGRIAHSDARFVGFDTFTGLPEEWYRGACSGTFSADGKLPLNDDHRCEFQVGMFQQTLPRFLDGFMRRGRIVLHLDADLYSSTLFVLASMAGLLRPGDLLFFDEFSTPRHEFQAFHDFAKIMYLRYQLVGAVNNFAQVCLSVN